MPRPALSIAQDLQALLRDPFRLILADFLECSPDPDAIKIFANKYPDRWAQAVAIMARLTGYHETSTVNHNLTVDVSRMSDSELIKRIQELDAPKVIEHQSGVASPSEGAHGFGREEAVSLPPIDRG